ncbi:MAG: stage II sporulation protein M [Roseiflexaceae bacterium]|nr:stage II sporulation protein M [Roseiflexus sp.]MDW8215352.1 stage II sporulation protein M [Roseiflexaceae bacterium]
MLVEDFINRKKPSWERLSAIVERSRRGGLASLEDEEITELGRLYRSATSDLAVARRDFPNHRVVDYLNGLVARAHAEVYQRRADRSSGLVRYFAVDLPRTFRETWPYTLASLLMFLIPALIGFFVALNDPAAGSLLVPGVDSVISDIRAGREWWKVINDEGRSASAALIATNNIRVAILAFAGGVLLGALTLLVLAQNGLLLGVVAGAAQAYGFSGNLWGFVAAHGVIELSVIIIAGGAGLQLGWAVARPGLLSRRAALALAARRAVRLLLGCALLLIVAGVIEGFISPSDLPLAIKFGVAFLSGVALYAYLLLAGRERKKDRGISRKG